MGFNKLSIADDKFDLNLKFYYWLKHLVKTSLTETQANNLLLQLLLDKKLSAQLSVLDGYSQSIKSKSKSEIFYKLIANIATQTDMDIFIFSLKLYMIKDLLLAEAKLKNILDAEAMSDMDPLSLAYDEKSLYRPYATRVNGALLSLVFLKNLRLEK